MLRWVGRTKVSKVHLFLTKRYATMLYFKLVQCFLMMLPSAPDTRIIPLIFVKSSLALETAQLNLI